MGEVIYILGICYIVLFGLSVYLKDNSIVDVFWGIGFLIVASVLFIDYGDYSISKISVFGLIILWSLRISIHIGKKKFRKKGEDARYATWRKEWNYFYLRSFFQVYILQMLLLLIVSAPLYIIFAIGSDSSNFMLIIGSLISLTGLIYESIADIQLDKYLQNSPPKNTIFTGGLFRYSRHPNYLGEIVFWFGILIISLEFGYLGIIGFGTIACLLLFVSGVPMKEVRYKRKSNWNSYSKRTPIFIPNYTIK